MEKLYTDKEYAMKAIEANTLGQQLYIHTFSEDAEIDVPEFEIVEEEYQEMVVDEEGNPVLDENGDPTYETKTREVSKPIMIEVTVPVYDEEGNQIGEETQLVQKTHKEIVQKEFEELLVAPFGYYVCYEANFTDGTVNENFAAEELEKAKAKKNEENLSKAKAAVENGYVIFKEAEFETNAQTVGDLTATMLLMQASGLETYMWLSLDDKPVELTIEDFMTLGGLIAAFKNNIWNGKYLLYKTAIDSAETVEEVEGIEIDYESNENSAE